jgi:ribosomal-protein-alanine N-acetyltransferase
MATLIRDEWPGMISPGEPVVGHGWRARLPVLRGASVELRELRASDASSLCALLSAEEVRRFVAAPPSSAEGFRRFIDRMHEHQMAGTAICYGVTMRGDDTAIGVFQVRETEPGFSTAEWGFAIGSPFWGTGVFREAAELVMAFAFEQLRVHRLEARAVSDNGRGNRSLQKLGAVAEGILRRSFCQNGIYFDQTLYAIVEDDWRASRRSALRLVH